LIQLYLNQLRLSHVEPSETRPLRRARGRAGGAAAAVCAARPLAECKWGEPASLAAAADELRDKVAHYPLGGATPQLRVFTRRRWAGKPPPAVKVHSLDALYAL
jgi:hypothetical protein